MINYILILEYEPNDYKFKKSIKKMYSLKKGSIYSLKIFGGNFAGGNIYVMDGFELKDEGLTRLVLRFPKSISAMFNQRSLRDGVFGFFYNLKLEKVDNSGENLDPIKTIKSIYGGNRNLGNSLESLFEHLETFKNPSEDKI